MTIQLISNGSDNRQVGKSLTVLKTYDNAYFKDANSILNPVIVITDDLSDIEFNYLYIEELDRYYFVDDIIYSFNEGYTINCSIDVLESYKTDILSKTAIISRQEQSWNLYIGDDMFKVYQNPHIITKSFPLGFSNPSYILVVAGG